MDSDDPPRLGYGEFSIGGLRLALAMGVLREVVPCGTLSPLPCPAACVIGGLDLRGAMVPVVDLRVVLGRPVAPLDFASVIIMAYEGKLLGLLADGVGSISVDPSNSLQAVSTGPTSPGLFSGCILGEEGRSFASVLSPQALAELAQVPMSVDPEPARCRGVSFQDPAQHQQLGLPVMLLRCGRMALAIDAIAVHATLAQPRIEASVLARGHCRGVIDHAGAKVPAVDLLALCGQGALDPAQGMQAITIRLETGFVAFLVGQVLDIVRTRPGDVLALPACALPQPDMFCGMLPAEATGGAQGNGAGAERGAFFMLDSAALASHPEVITLAATNVPGLCNSVTGSRSAEGTGALRREFLTYALGFEVATPLDQVTEILPCNAALSPFGTDGPLLGVIVRRGRSIPVLCLSMLIVGRPAEIVATTSVLVVETEDGAMGFLVPLLKGIESADWEPELPRWGGPDVGGLAEVAHGRKLALVGSAESQRMVPVVDLARLAGNVCARADLCTN